jgi:hypothetical protein
MKSGGFDAVICLPPERTTSMAAAEVADIIKIEGQEESGFTAQVELIGASHIFTAFSCAKIARGSRVCMAGMLAGDYFFTEDFSPMSIVSLFGVVIVPLSTWASRLTRLDLINEASKCISLRIQQLRKTFFLSDSTGRDADY